MNRKQTIHAMLILLLAAAMLPAQEIYTVTTTDYYPVLQSMAVNPATGDLLIAYYVGSNSNNPGIYLVAGRQKGNGSYTFGKDRQIDERISHRKSAKILWNPVTERFLLIYFDDDDQQLWLQELNKKGKTVGNKIDPAFDGSQLVPQAAATFRRGKSGEVEDLVLVYQLSYGITLNGKSSPAGLYMHVLDPETYAVRTESRLVEQFKIFDSVTGASRVYEVAASPKGDLFVVARRQVAEPGEADEESLVFGYMIKSSGKLKKWAEVSNDPFVPHLSTRWYSKKGAVLTITRDLDGITRSVVESVNRRMKTKEINTEFQSTGIAPNMVSSYGPDGPLLQLVVQGSDYLLFSLDSKGRFENELLYTTPSEPTEPSLNSILSDYIEKSGSVVLLHSVEVEPGSTESEIRVLHLVLSETP